MTKQGQQTYARGHRALEIAAIVFVFAALGWLGFRVGGAAARGRDWFGVGISAVLGYVVADFISGFVHWAGDTLGDAQTPVFGRGFVTPFRYHHVDPKDVTLHDFVETNGNNCIVVAPVLGVLMMVTPRTVGLWFYACTTMVFTSLFLFCTNQFHKWAHEERASGLIRRFQRMGLILSPERHALHHASPQDRSYCITVGWMNPVLDRIGFFRACEAIVSRVLPGALRSS
jgi:TMEM189-like protein